MSKTKLPTEKKIEDWNKSVILIYASFIATIRNHISDAFKGLHAAFKNLRFRAFRLKLKYVVRTRIKLNFLAVQGYGFYLNF